MCFVWLLLLGFGNICEFLEDAGEKDIQIECKNGEIFNRFWNFQIENDFDLSWTSRYSCMFFNSYAFQFEPSRPNTQIPTKRVKNECFQNLNITTINGGKIGWSAAKAPQSFYV